MCRTFQSLLLVLALSAPVFAGDMQCPVVRPASGSGAPEEAALAASADETDEMDEIVEMALNLLESLLSLL
jgi:hypothetical protein